MPTIDEFIEHVYSLNVGLIGVGGERHERPHKPLLLLAVLDLIDDGLASPDHIPWSQDLRDRFTALFDIVRAHNDQNTPDNPFLYLRSDGFWSATMIENGSTKPLNRQPLVGEFHHVVASFSDGCDILVSIPENRQRIREALVSRYFPRHAASLLGDPPPQIEERPQLSVAEDEIGYGRSPAFRRKILEIYDHQCAACGLRIRLPADHDVSFIDAAHLIPFSESRNDHPTNGLALCKNHHWAMDRNIIAPGPDRHWHVAPVIDPRRSNGERDIHALAGQTIILPKDTAFHPTIEGLVWRFRNLSA